MRIFHVFHYAHTIQQLGEIENAKSAISIQLPVLNF